MISQNKYFSRFGSTKTHPIAPKTLLCRVDNDSQMLIYWWLVVDFLCLAAQTATVDKTQIKVKKWSN